MQGNKHNPTANLGQEMSKNTSAYRTDSESQRLRKLLNDGISFAFNSAEMKADNLKPKHS
jgi:hypothetical protein